MGPAAYCPMACWLRFKQGIHSDFILDKSSGMFIPFQAERDDHGQENSLARPGFTFKRTHFFLRFFVEWRIAADKPLHGRFY